MFLSRDIVSDSFVSAGVSRLTPGLDRELTLLTKTGTIRNYFKGFGQQSTKNTSRGIAGIFLNWTDEESVA